MTLKEWFWNAHNNNMFFSLLSMWHTTFATCLSCVKYERVNWDLQKRPIEIHVIIFRIKYDVSNDVKPFENECDKGFIAKCNYMHQWGIASNMELFNFDSNWMIKQCGLALTQYWHMCIFDYGLMVLENSKSW